MGQYIGARYVPRFMGTYDNTQIYEALDVVDNGLGTSYISKIPTPAGTPLSNTTYWAIYGASSGAIVNLQNQIDDMNAHIDTISGANRNFLLIADSYGMRSESQPTWTEILAANLPQCRQKSSNGSGFTRGTTFIGDLTAFNNELTDSQKYEVTDIVACGGWNDARSLTDGTATKSTLAQAIYDFVDYAKAHFPNAKVWVGFIGWQSYDSVQRTDVSEQSLLDCQYIYNNSIYDNLYHIANCNYVMKCCKFLDSSYFHPNPAGSERLAYLIYNNIIGNADFCYNYTISASDITVDLGAATFDSGRVSIVNGIAKIHVQLTGVTTDPNKRLRITFDKDVLPFGHLHASFFEAHSYTDNISVAVDMGTAREATFYFSSAVSNAGVICDWTVDTTHGD